MLEKAPSRFKGKTYESTYTGWLDFFKELAESSERIRVVRYPVCWSPFLRYMGHVAADPVVWFLEDQLFEWPSTDNYEACRRVVEVSSTCRPELAHALYIWDTEWSRHPNARQRTAHQKTNRSKEFVVTCNASFFREEVLDYLEHTLPKWIPGICWYRSTLVLVPCAADKPYPAPMHQAVKKAVPDAYLMVATGVLGLVPEDLWPQAPNYDSGIPNNERMYDVILKFFSQYPHPRPVIVYSDFYAKWIVKALKEAKQKFLSVFGDEEILYYYDLVAEKNLERLRDAYACFPVERRPG
jgi:hypothetical protein